MGHFKGLSKWWRYYSGTAVCLLNTILLFLIINMLCWITIKIRDTFFPHVNDNLLEIYSDMNMSDISLLLEETWNRPWQYEPWVGFKERPRSGKFVNVSHEGFRHSYRKNLKLDNKGISIYVFGGSTTFGYGLDDASTIPSHLQRYLNALYPEKMINVYNFGRAYYYTTQELDLLHHLLKQNHVPIIAVFIDGLNDGQMRPYYSREMTILFDAFNYSNYRLIRITLSRIVNHCSLMRVLKKLKRVVFRQTSTDDPDIKLELNPDAKSVCAAYLTNRETIHILSAQYGFTPYFFIQPVPGYRNHFSSHMFMPKDRPPGWNQSLKRQMALLEKTADNESSFSLAGILEKHKSQPFVDEYHYTSEVCEKIAVCIGQRIRIP